MGLPGLKLTRRLAFPLGTVLPEDLVPPVVLKSKHDCGFDLPVGRARGEKW